MPFSKPIARVTADILRAKLIARITGTPLPDLTRLEARRRRLVAQSEALRKTELEIAVRFEERMEPQKIYVQVYPSGEENIRCPDCQKLHVGGCWGCRVERELI